MRTYAVVTGASSGIGKAICLELAKRGYDLILVSKNKELLEAVCDEFRSIFLGRNIIPLPANLENEAEARSVADQCINLQVDIGILVNCAGFAVWSAFATGSLEAQLGVINVNMVSPLILLHKLLPVLKRSGKRYVLNVSSTTIFQPTPFLSAYAGSKKFIKYFTDCLRAECQDDALTISCLIPGSTKTNFSNRAQLSETIINKAKPVEMEAGAVAKKAIDGLFSGKKVIIPGMVNKAHYFLAGILPATLATKMTYSIYKK
jgi:short-subunit dehydrogenase